MNTDITLELGKSKTTVLPKGVEIFPINTHEDNRGSFTEVFRNSWCESYHFLQWNYLTSYENTLRGVHIHPIHTDFIIMLTGTLIIGLLDLRKLSPTFLKGSLIEVTSTPRQAIKIPNGIAHGLYCKVNSSYLIAYDRYWSAEDDLECHWESTKKYIPWPCERPILSSRDLNAQNLELLQQQLEKSS